MLKYCFSCMLVCFSFVIPVLALFAGDSCSNNDRTGSCVLLSECEPLLADIQAAGTPIPIHMRRRLQSLTCGFEYQQPLVCCIQLFTNTITNVDIWQRPTTTESSWNPRPIHTTTESFITNNWNTNEGDNNDRVSPAPAANGEPESVENHRNLRLLPTDCGEINNDDKIFGGNRTNLNEMPWMVLLAYSTNRGTEFNCGGTLISRWYVLTAAHCVSNLGSRLSLAGVVLGEYDVRTDPDCTRVEGVLSCAPGIRNVSITNIIAHKGYSPQNLYDDIALIRLAEPADISLENMKPICLPVTRKLQTQSLLGTKPIAAGWGTTEDGLQSPVLLKVELPVISNEDCQNTFNGKPRIFDTQLCAGGEIDRDSCGGDSGGPLMLEGNIGRRSSTYIQRGIVSFGSKRCGIGGFPGVYTRVSHYMKWILDNMRE